MGTPKAKNMPRKGFRSLAWLVQLIWEAGSWLLSRVWTFLPGGLTKVSGAPVSGLGAITLLSDDGAKLRGERQQWWKQRCQRSQNAGKPRMDKATCKSQR